MQTAQFCSFQPTVSLPRNQEMVLDDTVTQWANAYVLRKVQAKRSGERKAYTVFTAEPRAQGCL